MQTASGVKWGIHYTDMLSDPGSELDPGYLPCHERTEPAGFRKTSGYGSLAVSQQECFRWKDA